MAHYEVSVEPVTESQTVDIRNNSQTTTTVDNTYLGDSSFYVSPNTTWNNIGWTYSSTIYMYQLICPRCKTTNWGAIDVVVNCKGKLNRKNCQATLKAVSNKVDYEVPVG